MTNCTVIVLASQFDIIVEGDRNKIRMEDSAGRLRLIGNGNQVEIVRSWVACKL